MEENNTKTSDKESNLLRLLLFHFLPYWPLFALLLVVGGMGAWVYLRYATPVYEISATLLLKDEKKGADDSQIIEFLNIYTTKKIVENEVEVIRSRSIMREVVNNLHLYAQVWEEGRLKALSAYTSSPITIEAKEPQRVKELGKVYFIYTTDERVRIADQSYILNYWVTTPYGVLRFTRNANKNRETKNQLYFSLLQPKMVISSLINEIEVNPVSKLSTVINLKLRDEVPDRGEDILNEVTEAYNRISINDKNALAANTLAFIEERMKVAEGGLDSIERKIQQYKSQKGVIDLSTQGRLFLENVGDNDRKVADIGMQLAVLDQVERYVISKESKTGIVPSTLGVNDPILTQMLQRLYESELQYENLKQTVADNNAVLTSLRKEIEQIRPNILENIRNQRISLQASRGNLNATNNRFSSLLQTIPQKEKELLEISRQQSIKSNVYSYLLQKREETALSSAAGVVADSRVIDSGESSITPVGPNKMLIYIVALACAVGLGIVIIGGKEFLSDKILYRSDIENYIKIPIAAEISYVNHTNDLIIHQPESVIIAEQFRQLRAAVGLNSRNVLSKKLLITSSIAGEGKSFVAVNLALSIASIGKKVVLLDIDLRNPKSSFIFGLGEQKGVTEYLEGEISVTEIIKKSKYSDLYIIPAGGGSYNPTDLLIKGNLNELFTYLEPLFDYILVDTSPADPVTDAYVLSEYCDKTLFIVRHGYTPKTMVQLLNKSNKIKGLKNLTIVFNGIKKRGFIRGGYGYGYGYGYENVFKVGNDLSRKMADKVFS